METKQNRLLNSQILPAIMFAMFLAFLSWADTGNCEIVFEREFVLPPVQMDSSTYDLVKNGRWAEAMDSLTDLYGAPDCDPAVGAYIVHGYKSLGMNALSKHELDLALEYFEQGLLYDNLDPDLHLGIGLCHMMRSDYDDAEFAFQNVVSFEPRSFLAHVKLGEIAYLRNELEQAAEWWREALRLKSGDKNLKRRLEKLERQLALGEELDVEADRYFSVVFDGESNPELSYTVMEMLGDAYFEIGQSLYLYPKRQIAVTLVTRSEFRDITDSPEWADGLYEGQIKVPVAGYDPRLLRTVLKHEYVHAVIYDLMSARCPWWLNEGLAQYLSDPPETLARKKSIATGLLQNGNVPSLQKFPGNIAGDTALVRDRYALALSAVRFFVEEFTMFNLVDALESLADGKSMDDAMREATGFSMAEFQNFWRNTVVQ